MKNSKKMNNIAANDSKSYLFSGGQTFICPDDDKKQFGMAGAHSLLNEEGFVKILINNRVDIKEEDGNIELLLPESWAVEFSEKIQEVISQLKHLRSLNKLVLLNEKAIYNNINDKL
ncbi:MAG: hypothetical protein WBP45_07555, partial [Daejeonella sp.]